MLNAIIRRNNKRQRARTDQDGPDDPSHNARAAKSIAIVFGVHIVAIILIFLHWSFLSKHTSAPASATVSPPAAVAAEGAGTFTISRGDTYTTIANHLGIPEAAIRAANPVLTPGTKLVIPDRPANAPAPPETATRAGAQDDGLIEANPVVTEPAETDPARPPTQDKSTSAKSTAAKSTAAKPGADKTPPRAIPVEQPAKTATRSYTVRKGDNLWQISKRYKIDQKALMRANGITDPNKIKAGMALKIP
jgi:LysM repeat protein